MLMDPPLRRCYDSGVAPNPLNLAGARVVLRLGSQLQLNLKWQNDALIRPLVPDRR